MNTLIKGIVGSTAYGLQTENSDVDFLGVFAHDTIDLVGLDKPVETVQEHEPADKVMHEAAKFARLCLGGNPTLNELLWLPQHLYITSTELGAGLIFIRRAFLSKYRVRDSYLGYADQQFRRYLDRGKFNSDISDKRASKHARHLFRLVLQGYQLYTTANLTVRLEKPQDCWDFAEMAVNDPDEVKAWLEHWKREYNEAKSPLPMNPDYEAVSYWLRQVRLAYWSDI
jgi:predicted nucleotidyltransferase